MEDQITKVLAKHLEIEGKLPRALISELKAMMQAARPKKAAACITHELEFKASIMLVKAGLRKALLWFRSGDPGEVEGLLRVETDFCCCGCCPAASRYLYYVPEAHEDVMKFIAESDVDSRHVQLGRLLGYFCPVSLKDAQDWEDLSFSIYARPNARLGEKEHSITLITERINDEVTHEEIDAKAQRISQILQKLPEYVCTHYGRTIASVGSGDHGCS